MSQDCQPNREQASRWNESSGPIWVEMQEVLAVCTRPSSSDSLKRVSRARVASYSISDGARVPQRLLWPGASAPKGAVSVSISPCL